MISSMKFSKFNRLIEFTKRLFKNKDYVFFFLSFPFFFVSGLIENIIDFHHNAYCYFPVYY